MQREADNAYVTQQKSQMMFQHSVFLHASLLSSVIHLLTAYLSLLKVGRVQSAALCISCNCFDYLCCVYTWLTLD